MRRNCTWALALALLLSTYCSQPTNEKIDISKARTGFRLTDGSAISSAEYAEYNPQLIQRPDGKLALIFASDRPCAGCSAGMHNLFIAVSVDEYLDDLQMPEFNTPVAIRPNGSTYLNSAQRIRYGAFAFSGNIAFAYQTGVGTYSFELDPATQLTGIGAGHGGIGNSTRTTDSFLGFGPEVPSMISRDGSMVVRYSKISAAHNGRSPDNFLLTNAENISIIPSSVTGFNTSMLIADAGGVWFSTLQYPLSPAFGVNNALFEADLLLSNANVSATTAGFADFLLFSADDGVSDDMYVVTSHSVADLWLQETFAFGDFSDSAAVRNVWTTLSATMPVSIGGMAAAAVGSKVYFFGGTSDGSTAVNSIYEFDATSETFTNCGGSCGTWPTTLHGATAIESGGLIYVVGGSTTTGAAGTVNVIRSFNPGNQAITAMATMPASRQITSLAEVSGNIYMLGGGSVTTECAGSTTFGCTTNYRYDITGNSWSGTLAAVPYGFSSGAAAAFGDSIFVFGGFVNAASLETNSVAEYSVAGNSWTNCGGSCPSLGTGRYSHQAITYGTSTYIVGGANQGGTSFNSVEEFDLLTKTFTNCAGGCTTMPLARNVGSAVLYNGQIYYFGGNNGGPYVNTIYKYVP
ncbi:MAG TPA: kelch repeat-containing protein [Accumulibacter sp.]|nr:kelch repeat-containing protein [Accumulibacter sp.]